MLHIMRVEAWAPPADIFNGMIMTANKSAEINLLKISPDKRMVSGNIIVSIAYSKQ